MYELVNNLQGYSITFTPEEKRTKVTVTCDETCHSVFFFMSNAIFQDVLFVDKKIQEAIKKIKK